MKIVPACAALLILFGSVAVPPSTEADSNLAFSIGGAFHIGGTRFHIAMSDGYYGPAYFYRTPHRLRAPGYACHGACYRSAGQYYHHPYCPVAEAWFHTYGFTSYDLFVRYAPKWRGPVAHGGPWGPWFTPGHLHRAHAHHGVWAPPIAYYSPYGWGNPDRSGARYEPWDRRGRDKHDKKRHHDD
jgi:hypothetical protein